MERAAGRINPVFEQVKTEIIPESAVASREGRPGRESDTNRPLTAGGLKPARYERQQFCVKFLLPAPKIGLTTGIVARRSRNSGIADDLFEVLEAIFQLAPPWTAIPAAAIGFLLISWLWAASIKIPQLQIIGFAFGFGFAALCLIAGWKGSQFQARQRQFLRANIDLNWVRGLSWRDFERQLAAVYRQRGYSVEETGGGGPDGGIDLKLFKDGQTIVVQCKHWKTWTVNVKPVRELFGVMTAERADAAIFVTSGDYTTEARKFAQGKPIQLVDRSGFLELVQYFQRDLQRQYGVEIPASTAAAVPATATVPLCPLCQNPMVLRTAKKGKMAGSQFWGCSRYFESGCSGKREI